MDPNVRMKFSLEIQGYVSNVFVGAASELARAEPEMLKALDDGGITWAEYYFNPADQARNGYLRMGTVTDPLLSKKERFESQERIVEAMEKQRMSPNFMLLWASFRAGTDI